jgi:protein-S-isoprenylcysteine O-methyltransferase Ste14
VAVVTIVVARPTWASWTLGLFVAIVGEAVRVWAAGHLEKSREITMSGPYRWTRHPLYVGSAVLASGVVIASRSVAIALIAAIYLGSTITAAIRTEEAFLRRTFGEQYDRYAQSQSAPMARRFSVARAMRNREYRAVGGLLIGFALLALKVLLPI